MYEINTPIVDSELGSCLVRLATMMPPVPPWAVGNTPEPVSLDIDGFIDVSAYVRLEEDLTDIKYGVLDIQVNFHHEGSLMNVYLLHFFALAENYGKCAAVVPGWMDGFSFPPALSKMRVWYRRCCPTSSLSRALFKMQCAE